MTVVSPLIEAPQIAASVGAESVYLKVECVHPTGTHKLRAARLVIRCALQNGFTTVTVGSCGNYGVAIAFEAARLRLRCHVFVPANFSFSRTDEMFQYGAVVRCVEGTYEDAVDSSRQFANQCGAYDCNVGGVADDLIQRAYGAISDELHEQVRGVTAMWIPVGDGTTLAGVYNGFLARDQNPAMYAVGSAGNNAACASIAAGTVTELKPTDLRPSTYNEPLVNWRSAHAQELVSIVRQSSGGVIEVTDAQLIDAARQLEMLAAVRASPSGAAGLAGLAAVPPHLRIGRHVVIVTGAEISTIT